MRLHHEHTGPTWDTPHTTVGSTVFDSGDDAEVGPGGIVGDAEQDDVAAFVAGSPMVVEVDLATDVTGLVELTATGWFEHAPDEITELGRTELIAGSPSTTLSLNTAPLPDQVGIFVLDLATDHSARETIHTRHRLALAWAPPVDGTPLYEQTVTWASTWAAGTPSRAMLPAEQVDDTENAIASRLLRGIWSLGEQGYSYGPVRRPKDRDNQAHVLLDHKRAACGEYRGLMLALLEYHGIDAQWLMMAFKKPRADRLSMYETRPLPAVGTETKVWRHWNHAVVELNGQIYDPTYGLHAASFNEYEDDLFASYCTGQDTRCEGPDDWCHHPQPEGSCVANPPGFDRKDPFNGMRVWRGDDY